MKIRSDIILRGTNDAGVSISIALTDPSGNAITLSNGSATVTDTSWVYVLPSGTLTVEGTYGITLTTSKLYHTDIILTEDIVLDTTPPQKPTIDLNDADDTGIRNDDNKTKISSGLTFLVSGEVGIGVVLYNSNTPIESTRGTISASGEISIDTSLSEGIYLITAIVTDAAGNINYSNPLFIVVDSTPPTSPAYTPPTSLTVGVPTNILETSTEVGVIYTASNLPSGLSINPTTGDITGVPLSAVTSITTVIVTATDDVGNEVSTQINLPPIVGGAIETLTTLDKLLDTNLFINAVENTQNIILSGTNEAGVSVTLALSNPSGDAIILSNGTATVSGTSWTYTLPTGTLAVDGTYEITLTTSKLSNADITLTEDITVDTTPPQKPTIDLDSRDDSGIANNDNKTKHSTRLNIDIIGAAGTSMFTTQ